MEQGMKQQRGAALVIVLALLTGALVVGVSGMQSSLIDERLAGNYSAMTQAQMAAEAGASTTYFKKITPGKAKLKCEDVVSKISKGELDPGLVESTQDLGDKEAHVVVYHVIYCSPADLKRLIVGQVKSNDMRGNDPNVYVASYIYEVGLNGDDGNESAGFSIVGGSEGVELKGSAKVVGGIKTKGEVEIEGGSSVDGNVEAGTEGVELKGSASVSGGIKTPGDIEFEGSSKADGKVEAGGEVDMPEWWGDDRINRVEGDGNIGFDKFLSQLPDVDAIYERVDKQAKKLTQTIYGYDDIKIGEWPNVDGFFKSDGLSMFNKRHDVREEELKIRSVEFDVSYIPGLNENLPVVRTKGFDQSNGSLTVVDDTVLIVDGDFTLGDGGGKSLIFKNDEASLTVFVSGEVSLHSSLDMKGVSVNNAGGEARFSIYSVGDDVDIDGSAHVAAKIYAPKAEVDVEGSAKLRGAVWGEKVEISGSSSIVSEGGLMADGSNAISGGGYWQPYFLR